LLSKKGDDLIMDIIFGDVYSKYYNLLYKEKNYVNEFNYINNIIKANIVSFCKNISILDIGCGTGRHLRLFKDAGYTVFGIDLSESMLFEARKTLNQEENLICDSASNFNFHIKFDVVISLFHVMSYQIETEELESVFKNIKKHLADNGLFIFDFWYGPAVLSDPPTVRIKRFEDEEIKITRIAEPVMHYNENIVDVNYEMILEDKRMHFFKKIIETHKMRYLFLPEIKKIADDNNLTVLNAYQWLDFLPLSEKSWYGVVLLTHTTQR
jgi:SAM-dependent methyltransferase